LLHGIPVPQGQ